MTVREASLFVLAPVLVGVAHLPAPESIEFTPDAGTEVTKVFREDTTWNVDSMTRTVDGGGSTENPDLSVHMERRVRVTDTYHALAAGRPLKLGRSVDDLGGSSTIGIAADDVEERYDVELESSLAGEELEFEWDDDDEEYRCRLAGGEKGGSVLEGLEEDMDFRALLPRSSVEEGGSWTVDLAEAGNPFAPGGDWKLLPESLPDGPYRFLRREDTLASALIPLAGMGTEWEGEIAATWTGTRTEDGLRIAIVELEIDAAYETDLVDALAACCEHVGYETNRIDQTYTVMGRVEGTGTLRWNLSAGHFESVTMECQQAIQVEMGFGEDIVAGVFDVQIGIEPSGTSHFEAEIERD